MLPSRVLLAFCVVLACGCAGRAPRTTQRPVEPPDRAERRFAALINEARSEQGLRLLEWSPPVADIARSHSQDMARHGFVGHRSPRSGGPVARMRNAKQASGLVLENVATGSDVETIHTQMMASPTHRTNLLNPDVTHLGVGVASPPRGSRLLVTQLFVRLATEIDPADAARWLVDQINRARGARGASPLESDANFAEAARQAAEAFFKDPALSKQDTVDDATRPLKRFAIAYQRVASLMAVVTSVDEAAQLEPTFDPEVDVIGIGVAQGQRPDTPPNAIAVVIVLGWYR